MCQNGIYIVTVLAAGTAVDQPVLWPAYNCDLLKNATSDHRGMDAAGRLMRTILYSTEHVSANNWETGLFILFLMVFAIAASAYVLYHGLQASNFVPVHLVHCTNAIVCADMF